MATASLGGDWSSWSSPEARLARHCNDVGHGFGSARLNIYSLLSKLNQKLLPNIHSLTAGFKKIPARLEFFFSVMASLTEFGNSRLNLTIAIRFGVCGHDGKKSGKHGGGDLQGTGG
jgi:hypothetical protein